MMAISGQIIKVWHVEVYTKELFSSSFTSLITFMINEDCNMMTISSQITRLMGINIIPINCFVLTKFEFGVFQPTSFCTTMHRFGW